MTGLTNPFGEGFGWSYGYNSWLQTQTLANGVTTANTYDGDGNPTTYGGNSLSFDASDRLTAFGSQQTNG